MRDPSVCNDGADGAATSPPGPPADLRAPKHRVDPRARHVWRLAALLGWCVPVAAAAVVYALLTGSRPISGTHLA